MTARKQRHCVHCSEPIHKEDGKWVHDDPTSSSAHWCESQNPRSHQSLKPAGPEAYKCGYCARTFPFIVRHHSGVRECGDCWNWRKLDGPAARYWTKAIANLFSNDDGAGPDLIDYQQWERWGIRDELVDALNALETIRERYEIAIEADAEGRRAVLGYPPLA